MNYNIALLKSLKAVAFVFAGAVAAVFLTPDFLAASRDVIVVAASKIPLVGGLLVPVINTAAVAFFTAVAVGIENWRKNRLK